MGIRIILTIAGLGVCIATAPVSRAQPSDSGSATDKAPANYGSLSETANNKNTTGQSKEGSPGHPTRPGGISGTGGGKTSAGGTGRASR